MLSPKRNIITSNNLFSQSNFNAGIFFCLSLVLFSLLLTNQVIVILTCSILICSLLYQIYGKKVILFLIIVGYISLPSDFFGSIRIYINVFLTGILVLLFIKEFGFNFITYPKLPKSVNYFILALFITLSISSIFSDKTGLGFFTIITMLAFFLICYIFFSFLKDEKNIYLYIYSIITAVIFLSIRIFLDLFSLGIQNFLIRSLLKDKIELYSSNLYTGSVIFFISLTFSVAMLIMNKFKTKTSKTLFSFFFGLNILILILANSRGLIIAALVSSSFILFVYKRKSFLKIFFIIVLFSLLIVFSIPEIESTVNQYTRTGTTHREVFWEAGVEIMFDNILTGIGPQSFVNYFYSYAPSSIFSIKEWKEGSHTPHNFFLYYAAENGILGFLIGINLFILFFYLAFKTMKLSRNIKHYFILSTAITGIGIGFFIRSFVEVTGFLYYGFITTDLPFWLIFGILIFLYQKLNVIDINT